MTSFGSRRSAPRSAASCDRRRSWPSSCRSGPPWSICGSGSSGGSASPRSARPPPQFSPPSHDILLTISFVSMMNLEVSLVVIAAILTIVGYSLNDTIVVFDRIRENLRKYKRHYMVELINLSLNETLPRTVMTGSTTLAATIALLAVGSEVIRGFAWVMTFGIVVGTFSSVFIASPILLAIERRWPGEDARGARAMVPPRGPETSPGPAAP